MPFLFLPCADSLMQPITVEDMVRLLVGAWKTAIATEKFCLWAALISCLYPTLSPKLLTLAVIPAE